VVLTVKNTALFGSIKGFKMWIWKRMGRITWLDKVTNDEVVGRVNEDRKILNSYYLYSVTELLTNGTW